MRTSTNNHRVVHLSAALIFIGAAILGLLGNSLARSSTSGSLGGRVEVETTARITGSQVTPVPLMSPTP